MTQNQRHLWIENIYVALDDTIKAAAPANRNPYEWVGEILWPTKAPRTAYARVKACLDEHQENTNFTPDEVMKILTLEDEVGITIAYQYIAESVNREVGEKKAPKSALTVLLEKQAAVLKEAADLQAQADKLRSAETAATLRAVEAKE